MLPLFIDKQLIIGSLPFPKEIIRIIKDYTFMDIIMYQSKKNKNIIIRFISNTIFSGKSNPENEEDLSYIFYIEEDCKCPQIQSHFCKRCGNFTRYLTNNPYDKDRIDKVVCHCI